MHGTHTPDRAPFRLAIVTDTYPPEVNGVAMTMGRLAGGLRDRGHAVAVIRPRRLDEPRVSRRGCVRRRNGIVEMVQPSCPLPRYPELRMGLPFGDGVGRGLGLWRPHVVHLTTEALMGLAAMRWARRRAVALTSSFHTNFHAYVDHYRLGALTRFALSWLRVFHNRTDLTLVPSTSIRERLRAARFRNCQLLSRGVDGRQFSPARRDEALRASWGVSPEGIALLSVGRIAPEKNIDLAVRAVDRARATGREVRLVLVGDGPLRDRYGGHPGVHLAGYRFGDELGAHYASADLFLFPSLTETFGNVLCEAMSAGLPAVAFDYASAAMHVRHGDNGWRVPYGDEARWLAAVDDALAVPADERARIGRAARAAMAALDWAHIAERFETLAHAALRRRTWRRAG